MEQIGSGTEEEKKANGGEPLRDDELVWVEGEIAIGLTDDEIEQINKTGEINDHIPSGGYIKGTSSFVTKNMDWFISSAFKPVRIISDSEARSIIDEANKDKKEGEKIPYDYRRRGGREFNAETMQLEDPKQIVRYSLGVDSLIKAGNTIQKWTANKTTGKRFYLELPSWVTKKVNRELNREINSHSLFSDNLIHIDNRHGINGEANNENSIPLTDEYKELIPYIMTAPSDIKKGTTKDNRDSVRFIKNISNGTVIVVEKEWDNSIVDLENITCWAELSNAVNAASNPNENVRNDTISRSDVAKIKQDAFNAIEKELKLRNTTSINNDSNVGYHAGDLGKAEFYMH